MKVIVTAPRGKMGKLITQVAASRDDMELVASIGPKGRDYIGTDLGTVAMVGKELHVPVVDDLESVIDKCDVIIDFSTKEIPMLYAANTSKLVNVMNKVLEFITKTVGEELDIEILEMHDQWKKDAPSGTSKEMGETMAHALGKELSDIAVYGREGVSPREPGTIGYHSLRAGNIPSSHTVFFGGMGERLEITHHCYNWECFARGACDCAAYLANKGPGYYTIKDVLHLS